MAEVEKVGACRWLFNCQCNARRKEDGRLARQQQKECDLSMYICMSGWIGNYIASSD